MRKTDGNLDWKITDYVGSQQNSSQFDEDTVTVSAGLRGGLDAQLRDRIRLAVCAVIGLSILGYAIFREAHPHLDPIKHEVQSTIALEHAQVSSTRESYASTTDQTHPPDDLNEHVANQILPPREFDYTHDMDIRIVKLKLHKNLAVATVEITESGPYRLHGTYVQLQFYRQQATEWVRVEPDASYFGDWQSLRTPHLTVTYRRHDADVVIAAANDADLAYARVRQELGLQALGERVKIEIEAQDTSLPTFDRQDEVFVPSPAIIPIPIQYSHQQVLTLWMLSPLIRYAIHDVTLQAPFQFEPRLMERILYQWQMRRSNEVLREWHHDVMSLVYGGSGASYEALAQQQSELCLRYQIKTAAHIFHHAAWMGSTNACFVPVMTPWFHLSQDGPPRHLAQLTNRKEDQLDTDPSPSLHWLHDMALESVFDYILAVYGPEKVQKLTDSFRYHSSWKDVLSYTFGITVTEFETGWNAYLIKRYSTKEESSVPH